jgi:flagellar basal body-associated protein FliL
MDYNNQYQIPQEPVRSSKSKVVWLIVIGVVLIALCGYILWNMYASTPVTSPQNQQSTAQKDDINSLDQQAATLNTTSLDTDLQTSINTELGS